MTPRMRTAPGLLEAIKAEDPGSEVTLHFLRRLIKEGKIPSVPCGRKKLADVDKTLAYLRGETSHEE